ncbi:MAG TPA: class I SAM-dependent methyltransferase [Herpetosiphonaceae bacterium]
MNQTDPTTATAGSAIYGRPLLSVYDLIVLWFSNRFAWRCPTPQILDFYNRQVGAQHLDIGVGTGYFLDKCRFPTPNPAITIVDLNANSLRATAERIKRYQPTSIRANVLEPLPVSTSFDSIGINYVLHCLAGNMESKAVVFDNLKPLLKPGGVVFGTTILGRGVRHNALARTLMRVYNAKGIFGNTEDSQAALEQALGQHFREYQVFVVGCVAFFRGSV